MVRKDGKDGVVVKGCVDEMRAVALAVLERE